MRSRFEGAVAVVVTGLLATACTQGVTDPEGNKDAEKDPSANAPADPTPTTSATPSPKRPSRTELMESRERTQPLAEGIRKVIRDRDFQQVIDKQTGSRTKEMPQVDAAVIELDSKTGRPIKAANVVLGEAYKDGRVVPVDASLDVSLPDDFESPYPASVLKLMIGFQTLRLVDKGELSLDDDLAYRPSSGACGSSGTRKVRDWFEQMITVSDNRSTCALTKMLYDKGAVDDLNETFQELGLDTLKVEARPETGGRWLDMKMTAMDTARLLLLVDGPEGVLWRTKAGKDVGRDVLSDDSRKFYLEMLAKKGFHRRSLGRDLRPCEGDQGDKETVYAHKTGDTSEALSDAGIVHALDGKPDRDYIVAVFTNLGTRYGDTQKSVSIPRLTPRFAALGCAIDTVLTRRAAVTR